MAAQKISLLNCEKVTVFEGLQNLLKTENKKKEEIVILAKKQLTKNVSATEREFMNPPTSFI